MRLILHIGTEKTGTTTLQEFLQANRERLAASGRWFLQSPGAPNNRALPAYFIRPERQDDHFDALGIMKEDARIAYQFKGLKSLSDEIEEAAKSCHTVIASSEHLHSRLSSEAELGRLAAFFTRRFSDIKIIVYLRKQIDTAISLYSTALKNGLTVAYKQFIDVQCRPDRHYFDYYGLLEKWSAALGRETIDARLYDRLLLTNGEITDDFSAAADLQDLDLKAPAKAENLSLDHVALTLLRAVNKERAAADGGREKLLQRAAQTIIGEAGGARLMPPEAEYRAVQSRFDQSNEALRSAYFPHLEQVFDDDYPSSEGRILDGRHAELIETIVTLLASGAPAPLRDPDADVLRDTAIALEKTHLQKARDLMAIAHRLRPNGKRIHDKLAEYDRKLAKIRDSARSAKLAR